MCDATYDENIFNSLATSIMKYKCQSSNIFFSRVVFDRVRSQPKSDSMKDRFENLHISRTLFDSKTADAIEIKFST